MSEPDLSTHTRAAAGQRQPWEKTEETPLSCAFHPCHGAGLNKTSWRTGVRAGPTVYEWMSWSAPKTEKVHGPCESASEGLQGGKARSGGQGHLRLPVGLSSHPCGACLGLGPKRPWGQGRRPGPALTTRTPFAHHARPGCVSCFHVLLANRKSQNCLRGSEGSQP